MNGLRPIGGAPIASLGATSDVAVKGITNYIIGRQEQPDHPGSWFQFGRQGFHRKEITDWFIGTQEQPWHPASFFWDPNEFDDTDPFIHNILITQQEPYHPLWPRPILNAGAPSANEWVKVYIIG